MNVPRIFKNGEKLLLGAMTLSSFIWFANVDMNCRAETLLNQTPTINTEHVEPVQEILKARQDSLIIQEVPKTKKKIAETREVECLARNIYHEARGQSKEGQYAVAIVTKNRTESGKFPSTIEKVIKQPGQFSWYKGRGSERIRETEAYAISKEIAKNVLEENGTLYKEVHRKLSGALYFCEKRVTIPRKRKVTARIGDHKFYI